MEFEICMHLTMNVAQSLMSEPLICSVNFRVINVYLMESGNHVILATLQNN